MLAKQDVSVCPPTGRTAPWLTEQSLRPPIATLLPADKLGDEAAEALATALLIKRSRSVRSGDARSVADAEAGSSPV
jgi:hypothetical protein